MQSINRDIQNPLKANPLHEQMEERFVQGTAWIATTFYHLTSNWAGWRPLLTRATAHIAIALVAVIAIVLSTLDWSSLAASAGSLPVLSAPADGEQVNATIVPSLNLINGNGNELMPRNGSTSIVARAAQPHTIIPDRPRLGIMTYTVQVGDTVQSIATAFGLEPTTIMWANPMIEDAPDLLRIGQQVVILPVDGVYHQVISGDTLDSIADAYEVEPEAIISCEYNAFESVAELLTDGEYIVVPGGEKPYVQRVVTSYTGPVPEGAHGTGLFIWPVLGRITQGYWYGHRAIDIGAPTGSALLAADSGFVSFAGWTDVGYGYLTVIDHANGFATYYAHQSAIYVYEGQAVERGQVIGAVGNTGWSTGPHLHFEVRYYNEQQNPRAYLP